MKLCSFRHIEVCYEEGDYCPVCKMRDEKQHDIVKLGNIIEELEEQLSKPNTFRENNCQG
jgi:hypothetical protein